MAIGAARVVARSSFPVLTSVRVDVRIRKNAAARKNCSAGSCCAGAVTVEAIGLVFRITPGRGGGILLGRKDKEKELVWSEGGAGHFAGQIGDGDGGEVGKRKRFGPGNFWELTHFEQKGKDCDRAVGDRVADFLQGMQFHLRFSPGEQ